MREYGKLIVICLAVFGSVAGARYAYAQEGASGDAVRIALDNMERLAAELAATIAEFRANYPAFAGGGSDSGSDSAAPTVELSDDEAMVIQFVNAYRTRMGLPAMRHDPRLTLASQGHSQDMSRRSFFSHNSPILGKEHFTDRARLTGTQAHAENIARGAEDGRTAMRLWVNSQGHRNNILGEFSRIGVGEADGYYTQLFGR